MFGGECYAKQIRVSDKIDILVMVDGEAPRAQKKLPVVRIKKSSARPCLSLSVDMRMTQAQA